MMTPASVILQKSNLGPLGRDSTGETITPVRSIYKNVNPIIFQTFMRKIAFFSPPLLQPHHLKGGLVK